MTLKTAMKRFYDLNVGLTPGSEGAPNEYSVAASLRWKRTEEGKRLPPPDYQTG